MAAAAHSLQPAAAHEAAAYRGPGRMSVIDKPHPHVEHPDGVILRITRTTIFGSDLHLYHGLVPDTRVGATFGHEFAGAVEEVGPVSRR
jgi:threonine dehydrogenase-like Zn-dependent dehydrogenase